MGRVGEVGRIGRVWRRSCTVGGVLWGHAGIRVLMGTTTRRVSARRAPWRSG